MKVLHINNVANVPAALVRGLSELGVDARLEQPLTGGFALGAARKAALGAKRVRDFSRVIRLVRAERYDLVHIHYAYFGVLGILGRFPFWLHCHGTDVRRNLSHPLYGPPTRLSLRRAAKVLYSTPDLEKHIIPHRPDAVFLPNPVDTDLFRPPEREPDPPALLLIARLDQAKGVDRLFAAVRELVARNPVLEVRAFAWGPDLERFKDEPVSFIPPVPHAEMAAVVGRSSIVLGQVGLGSIGQSELEAMACARPVVCDFRNTESYSESPPHLQAQTPQEIVEAVAALLSSPSLRKERALAGRDWVMKHHGHRTIAARLAALYRDWLDRPASGRASN